MSIEIRSTSDDSKGVTVDKKVTRLPIIVPSRYVPLPKKEIRIRVGQRQMRKSYPNCEGFIQISAWSGGKYPQLSPFFLGPILFEEGDEKILVPNLENYWQFSKLHSCHADPARDQNPTEAWYRWRKEGFQATKAVRHPMGKEKPLYSYYKGRKLGVVEAREEIYIPMYKELVRKTSAYQQLLLGLRKGQKLLLIEPDGPNLQDFSEGIEVDVHLLKKLRTITDQKSFHSLIGKEYKRADNKYFPLGHGYVLAEALLEDL